MVCYSGGSRHWRKGRAPPFRKLHVTGGLECACVFSITASGTLPVMKRKGNPDIYECNSEFSVHLFKLCLKSQ